MCSYGKTAHLIVLNTLAAGLTVHPAVATATCPLVNGTACTTAPDLPWDRGERLQASDGPGDRAPARQGHPPAASWLAKSQEALVKTAGAKIQKRIASRY